MAIHVPLSMKLAEALADAGSSPHFEPAGREPIVAPSQDMVIGNLHTREDKAREGRDLIQRGRSRNGLQDGYVALQTRVGIKTAYANKLYGRPTRQDYGNECREDPV